MKIKADKEILLRKALKRSFAMSDMDRLKQLSKKGIQFLVDCFLGSNIRRDYDRPIQESIGEFFNYTREKIRLTTSQERRRINQEALDILMRLFPTVVPILPGTVVQVPDIEDVDVISASEKHSLKIHLNYVADNFEVEPAVVDYPVTSSSGHETV